MSFGRLLLYLALLFGILFQFYLSGEWGENIYGYIFTGALLLLAAFLVMTGGKPKKRQRPRQRPSTKAVVDETDSFELPEAVVEEDDGGSRRDRKVAASKEASTSESDESDEEDVIQLEEEVVKEEVHIAEEYVVDIDAEQVEEADIEEFVEERRGKREEIKKRIEKRRRGQLADIRASAARMWSKQDGGEDLLSVLSQPGHGLTVLDEPENVETGHPYGATYVRIDDARILKLRIPLDSGFIAATEFEEEVEVELEELPPPPDGLPLPPPPTLGQSKLDSMREEIGE